MKNNIFIKLLCSIPVILLLLYFIPFLGVCVILFRYFIYGNDKYYSTPVILFLCGILILVPQIVYTFLNTFNISYINIPYINDIVVSEIYIKLLDYSKFLITVGIIFFIISCIFRSVFNKLSSSAIEYMRKDLQKDYEIRKENDLKMQEKREKAKNTHVVHCPYCGSDNMFTEKTGICRFCRRNIE